MLLSGLNLGSVWYGSSLCVCLSTSRRSCDVVHTNSFMIARAPSNPTGYYSTDSAQLHQSRRFYLSIISEVDFSAKRFDRAPCMATPAVWVGSCSRLLKLIAAMSASIASIHPSIHPEGRDARATVLLGPTRRSEQSTLGLD